MEAAPEIIKSIYLENEAATEALAQKLAPQMKAGDVLLLEGDLGAGKTSFARALIRALCGVDTDVPSPTFTLMQLYDAPVFQIAHFDLYRLSEPEDILELGWLEVRQGLVLVEWPQRLGVLKPQDSFELRLEFESTCRRAQFWGSKHDIQI